MAANAAHRGTSVGAVLGVLSRIGLFVGWVRKGFGLRPLYQRLEFGGGQASRQVLLTCYLLGVVAGSLLVTMQEIDGVLRQMHGPGALSGGGLGLPLETSTARSIRAAWIAYPETVPTTRFVATPDTLLLHLAWLDAVFIVVYGCLLGVVLATVRARVVPRQSTRTLDSVLRGAQLALGVLVVVDALEDVCLYFGYRQRVDAVLGIGGALTILKVALAAAVVVPLLAAVVVALRQSVRVRTALKSARVVLVVLGALALLLVVRIGAEQVDDVIRAWRPAAALLAIGTAVAAVIVVRGAVTALSGEYADNPQPESGADPQPILLGSAVVLAVVGFLAWGFRVAAGIAALLWLLGQVALRIDPGLRTYPKGPAPAPPSGVAAAGFLVARMAAAFLTAALIWVAVRAGAFDLYVRIADAWPRWLPWVLLFVVAQLVLGVAALVDVQQRWVWRNWWVLAVLAVLALWSTFVVDWITKGSARLALRYPMGTGSVAVLLVALCAGAGGCALVIVAVRRTTTEVRLPPALRIVGLRRFPVVAILASWALVVSLLDSGGFHDVRRLTPVTSEPFTQPPSLEEAYDSWLAADPSGQRGAARPLVLVAAQGGGIRAAIWTAMVMECVFGPSPVASSAKDGNDVCADGGGAFNAEKAWASASRPLPVFLASGASGGSVGLAAWAGRRVDLTQRAAVPQSVQEVLVGDYVAADLARMLSGDTLYGLIAHSGPDRAAVLERAWELAWGANNNAGMSRGLRASWTLANGTAGTWGMPILAMNASQVEDGCRFVASPVDFTVSRSPNPQSAARSSQDQPDDDSCGSRGSDAPGTGTASAVVDALPNTTELVDYLCPQDDLPLSTAAHLSARFPFVSPPGRIRGCSGDGLIGPDATSYAIDGGYFDNSGSATAVDAWRALTPFAAAREAAGAACVVPLLLQIDNSPSGGVASGGDPVPYPLAAPAQAVASALSARQRAESEAARFAFTSPRSAGGRAVDSSADTAYFRVAPAAQPGPTPPLGWTLSDTTVDDMRAQLTADRNKETIRSLRRVLAGGLSLMFNLVLWG
jgi:hypothetical protein